MPIEIHVPDLPPLTLGHEPVVQREVVKPPWTDRVREALSAYLPIVVMVALALATWWLVQNAPVPAEPQPEAAVRKEPDYTMQRFALQRYGEDGRLRMQVEGERLRHFPDTDTLEIDTVRIRAISPDGTVTLATARRAIANADASEVQLLGGAHVTSELQGEPLEFRGEFLHAFTQTERLRSHLPVEMRHGSSLLRAAGFEADLVARTVRLHGPMRGVFQPPARR